MIATFVTVAHLFWAAHPVLPPTPDPCYNGVQVSFTNTIPDYVPAPRPGEMIVAWAEYNGCKITILRRAWRTLTQPQRCAVVVHEDGHAEEGLHHPDDADNPGLQGMDPVAAKLMRHSLWVPPICKRYFGHSGFRFAWLRP